MLGFSIYPENHSLEKMQAYLDLLHRYQANRIFISLLQIDPSNQEVVEKYQAIIDYANRQGMVVIADMNPTLIKEFQWQDDLAKHLHDWGIKGVRLDESLDRKAIVELTHNPYDIKVELNMSTDLDTLLELLNQPIKKENIIGCHNFYPHKFTGLSVEHFLRMSESYKEKEIETAAFINSQKATEGPWPVSEGLCTVEDYRDLPLADQYQIIQATGLIDHIIIANQFVSEEELQELAAVKGDELYFKVELVDDVTPVEEKIIDYPHVYRGDISDYVVRSTWPRVKYGQESIPNRQQEKTVERGMILIDNNHYERYKGELQIALKSFTISDKTNIVGRIIPEQLPLLAYLKPWQEFRLIRK
ncbi:hypothetical protein SAMN05421767_1396 [Granulicatella balaenopterae]|uniref:Outer surface protein n=1 Tax=Granulicatella balaenopterae TaxID=137733 RepID=A0A1H9NG13_9LACT|nr:MupG family TIM beta-alpha barrel fold protein [Granulicatella balaenopterae]SER34924.1 hypothetical protein SAMN05421767_1396 [Granulicatella balaenopterae]